MHLQRTKLAKVTTELLFWMVDRLAYYRFRPRASRVYSQLHRFLVWAVELLLGLQFITIYYPDGAKQEFFGYLSMFRPEELSSSECKIVATADMGEAKT